MIRVRHVRSQTDDLIHEVLLADEDEFPVIGPMHPRCCRYHQGTHVCHEVSKDNPLTCLWCVANRRHPA